MAKKAKRRVVPVTERDRIRQERAAGASNKDLALKYGVSEQTISQIVNRRCEPKAAAQKPVAEPKQKAVHEMTDKEYRVYLNAELAAITVDQVERIRRLLPMRNITIHSIADSHEIEVATVWAIAGNPSFTGS